MHPFLIAASPPPQGLVGTLIGLAPLLVMLVIFYLIVFLPAMKKRKELQKQIDALDKGSRVVTTGGIYGEVAKVETTTLLLKVADNVRIRVAKSAIAGLDTGTADPGGTP
jgi:preprotein translocase subunit YajC